MLLFDRYERDCRNIKLSVVRHVAIEWDVLTDRRPDLKRYCDDDIK